MDKWVVRGKELPVWEALDSLGPALNAAEEQARTSNADSADIVAINRVRALHASIGKRLAGVDSYFLLPGPLAGVAEAVNNARLSVLRYAGNGSATDLDLANNDIDQALSALAGVAIPGSTEEFLAAKEAVDHLRQVASASIAELDQKYLRAQERAAKLQNEVQAIRQDIETEQAKAAVLALSQKEDFAAKQRERHTTFSEELANQLAALKAEGDEHRAKRDLELKELAALRAEAELRRDELLKSLRETFLATAETLHSEIIEKKAEVDKLVGIVGNRGVTAGYQKAATQAKKSAFWWQVITVGSLVLLASFSVASYFNVFNVDFTWPSFAARALVTLTFGLLAAYAGRQGAREQKRARADEELALKLAALGPFLAPLSNDKQDAVRMNMANLAFVNPPESRESRDAERDGTVGMPVASEVINLVGKGVELVLRRGS